ncbi:MAG: hypothetical protein JXR78_00610, partial [Victivallales bacterium]|nr:hypothetical protein [Victivallales bacterium]
PPTASNIAIGHLLARHALPELLTIYPFFPIPTFGGRVNLGAFYTYSSCPAFGEKRNMYDRNVSRSATMSFFVKGKGVVFTD